MPVIDLDLYMGVVVLAALHAVVLLPRLTRRRRRGESLWLLIASMLLAARSVAAPAALVREALGFPYLLFLGLHLSAAAGRRRPAARHLFPAAAFIIYLSLAALGFSGLLVFRAMFSAFLLLLGIPPLTELASKRLQRLALGLSLLLLLGAMGAELLQPSLRLAEAPSILLLLVTGSGLAGQERRNRQEEAPAIPYLEGAFLRLLHAEDYVVLQDRLIAAGILAAGAVHEVKNALANLQASAEYGMRATESQAKERAFKAIREQVEAGKGAVKRFLEDVLRKDGREPEAIDLGSSLPMFLQSLGSFWLSEGIRLEARVEAGLVVKAYRGELEQVLLNLVRNAAEALGELPTHEGGARWIRVTGYREAGGAVLEVANNGPAIAPRLEQELFDGFSSPKSSTGLGLYLARRLTARNGGILEYDPRPGECRFRLVFPEEPGGLA